MRSGMPKIAKPQRMKKKWLLACLLMFPLFSLQAQTFQQLTEKCLTLLKDGNIDAFEKTYPGLYTLFVKEHDPSYLEAITSIRQGSYSQAIASLNELIVEGYYLDEIKNDSVFTSLHNEKGWADLALKIDSIQALQNLPVVRELKEIQDRDQSIRLFLLEVEKRKENSLTKQVRTIMKNVDQESAVKVCNIIDKYGWLGSDEAGSEGNLTLFLAIQHVDDLIVQEKYLPLLKAAVQNGKADGWHLAFLTDRILMNQGKKQIYGTQKIINKDSGDWYIVPLQNPDIVDELRKEIGLSPLAEDLEEEGFTWNLEEYKKDAHRIEQLYRQRNEKLHNI